MRSRFKPFDIVQFGYGDSRGTGIYPCTRTLMLLERKTKGSEQEYWKAHLINDSEGYYDELDLFIVDEETKLIYRKSKKKKLLDRLSGA